MPRTPSKFRDFLERAGLRDVGVPTLLAAVVLFVSAMTMLGANVSAVRESYGRVQRSNSALLDMAEINTLVMGIDMCVRGYALTDNPDFLVFEADNRHRLGIAIDKLAFQESDNAAQAASIAKLRTLVVRQEALFSQLSSLGPGHAKEVAAAIVDPEKRKIRYAAQDTLTVLHDGETKLLIARQQAAERQVSRTFYLALGIVALAFIAGTIGFALTFFGHRTAV